MLKVLRRTRASEGGFTLIELLIVVLIVGVLAAVGVPLYLGYVRDARLAEGKSVAGSALTAAQACAQLQPATNCGLTEVAQRAGLNATSGDTGDGRWTVAFTGPVQMNTAGVYSGGPIRATGKTGNVTGLATRINIDSAGNSVECSHDNGTTWTPC